MIEQRVLGEIIIDPESINDIVDKLKPEHFNDSRNQNIYTLMLELYADNIGIDTVNLYSLSKKRKLDIGNAHYLSSLGHEVSSSANIISHAIIVIEEFMRRNLLKTAGKINESVKSKMDVFDLLEETQSDLYGLTDISSNNGSEISVIGNRVIEHLENARLGDISSFAVKTGYYDLDSKLAGLKNGDLIIIAARPGMGKTAFALSCLRNITTDDWAAIFSLEMNSDSLYSRLLSAESRIEYNTLVSGTFSNQYQNDIIESKKTLNELKLYVDDTAGITPIQLISKARKLKKKYDIKVIFLDYLQLMNAKANSREREIALISGSLKALAKELNIPVIALSQLNRNVESRQSKIPQLSDLRESGSIEQDADVVLFLYRPEVYGIIDETQGLTENSAQIIIAKQRNGITGKVNLVFNKSRMKFENQALL